jgi:glutathione-regulated potassium-efflux system ancillary protein KefC
MSSPFLFNAFIFLAAACLVVPLASRFKLGSVLGYLAAGVLIGPYGLGLIGNAEQIMEFGEFGVVMMLFVIGLELEPATLWRMRKQMIGLGGLQLSLTALAFTSLGVALGFDWRMSLAAGMALSLSSTAIVLQMLQEKNLMQTQVGETSFAVLLFQDIAVIGILVVVPLLATQSVAVDTPHSGALSALPNWMYPLVVAGVIGCVVAGGRYLSRYLFYFMAKTNLREVFTATSLALVIGITLLMQAIGISPALGAFIAGVVLASSEYKHTLEADIEPFKGLLLGLFFISIGMGMDFNLLASQSVILLAAVFTLLAVKILILLGLGRLFNLTSNYNIGFALALSQGGEFAFVLFQYANTLHVIGREEARFLTLVVALSMAATPLLMLLYSRYIVPRFLSVLPDRDFDTIDAHNAVILAGYGRFGQIIGRFANAQGVKLTVLEKDPDQIEQLRKFGVKCYFGDAAREELLRGAGAATAKLLVVAVDDADVCLEIVQMAKQEFPQLKILARARNRRHAYELHKAGVDYFKREIFDSSLSMAQEMMIQLGYGKDDMKRKAIAFAKHDEKTLAASFAFFEKEPELISFSRQASGEKASILQSDQTK